MQSEQLKSLVETGHYRPEPALVAEAMLRRRGVRELLVDEPTPLNRAGRNPPAPASRPPGSLISTPAPASNLADRREARRRFARQRSPGRGPAAESPRAARSPRRPQRRGAAGPRPRPPRPPRPRRRSAALGGDQQATPLAPARCRASPPSPSLRSIIAVAPAAASARPAARRGRGRAGAPAAASPLAAGDPGDGPRAAPAPAAPPPPRRAPRSGPGRRPVGRRERLTAARAPRRGRPR